ncbi:MAG: hypothetical protein RR517_00690 [Pseudomonas sp.]
MTVNTISSIAEFDTNGVTTNFPFYFKFLANEDLVVTYVDPLGVSSTLTLGTHYTVNGAGNDQGGSIVTTSALAGPGQLVVSREMEAFQQTSLRNQGKFLAEVHENVFDKLTMLIQQGLATFTRALKRPLGRDYFFAENRRITSVKDPEESQDAATKNSVEQYVGSVLSAIQGPINNSANVLYVRPSGTPGVVQDLATGEGYDYVGATLPTGVFSTVKGFFSWILDRITLSTSGSASIVAAVAKGGKVVIKNGGHWMLPDDGPAICNYDPDVGFAGSPSKRIDLSGETPGGTILSNQHGDYAIKLLGSYPITQNFGGFDRVGNLTIVGPNVTVPNTDNSGGLGLFIQTKAYTRVYNFNAFNLRRGLHLDGVLTSTVEDVTIDGCYEGMLINDTNNTSGPNAMNFRRIKIGGSTSNGARIEIGASTQFDNLTIEGCGNIGGISVGSLWQSKIGSIAANVTLNSPYFELNAGPADVYISHVAAQDMVFNVNGGLFHRTNPTRYTDVNFLVRSEAGAGKVTVMLRGVKFHGSFGYVPVATRPYFDVGPRCEVLWDEACQFSELTSMAYWLCLDREYTFTVASNGEILAGPDGFGCTHLGAGRYSLYRSLGRAEFGKFADDVAVQLTPGVGGFTAYVVGKTNTAIEIQLHSGSAVVDAKFDVSIKRVKGYYA